MFPAGAKSLLFTVWLCSGQAEFEGRFVFGFFGSGGFFNYWISGIVFPRHINVILEKLLLTPCQIFLTKWEIIKFLLLP